MRPAISFTKRILGLIADIQFIQFENILREPNFFSIVGRSHFERWHSAFWGWLFDPNGSHLTRDYALKRCLYLLFDVDSLQPSSGGDDELLSLLPMLDIVSIEVSPNENVAAERSVAGVGRFDIYCEVYHRLDTVEKRINIIIEMKVDAKPDPAQSKKYADWLGKTFPDDLNILIYILPTIDETSLLTVGDPRWFCLTYQILGAKLLQPLLDHPNLNEKVKPFIVQYIKNLKHRHKGVKMAITEEEKRLAVALYEKYSDVFDSIYDALVAEGKTDVTTSDINAGRGRQSGRIAVKVDGKLYTQTTVRRLLGQILTDLVDSELIKKIPLPWGTSQTRYVLTNETPALHPTGKSFFYPETYREYTIETHYDRTRAIKVIGDLCEKMEVAFETVDVG